MILVDTGAWYALAVADDPDHERASDFLETNRETLMTTDLIAVETMNLIRYRKRTAAGHARAASIGDAIWEGEAAEIRHVTAADIRQAREVFRKYDDKVLSFTDCTSLAIMRRLGIAKAFTFDSGFDGFPGIVRVPG